MSAIEAAKAFTVLCAKTLVAVCPAAAAAAADACGTWEERVAQLEGPVDSFQKQ